MTDEQTPVANGAAAEAQAGGTHFSVEKIYVKDVSFESPKSPQVFNEQGQPQLGVNLNQQVQRIGDNVYEVVMGVTLTCQLGEGNTVYVVEVKQAGVFGLAGFEPQVLEGLLSVHCPNILFPYARQLVSDLVQAGGFPPFLLQPVNFDAIYAEALNKRAEQQASAASAEASGLVGNA